MGEMYHLGIIQNLPWDVMFWQYFWDEDMCFEMNWIVRFGSSQLSWFVFCLFINVSTLYKIEVGNGYTSFLPVFLVDGVLQWKQDLDQILSRCKHLLSVGLITGPRAKIYLFWEICEFLFLLH